MQTINLSDMNNDIINIIGAYVKADNDERAFQEYEMRNIKKTLLNDSK
jgi:hypothetical protein